MPKKIVSTSAPLGKAYISWVWTVAIALVLAFVGYGISVLGYPSPPFGLARLCFFLSGAVLASAIVFTALNLVAAPLPIRLTISALGVAASMFMAIAGVVWIAWLQSEFDSQRRNESAAQSFTPATTATTATEATVSTSRSSTATTTATANDKPRETVTETAATEPDPAEPGGRLHPLVTADVRKMIAPYAELTSFEADARTNRYLGRWLRVDASVINISPGDRDPHRFFVVSFLKDGPKPSDIFIVTYLNDTTEPAVRALRRNEPIVLMGKVHELGVDVVKLEDCELISP